MTSSRSNKNSNRKANRVIRAAVQKPAVFEELEERRLFSWAARDQILGLDKLNSIGVNGAGQTIAVIDLGVDMYHPVLAGKIVASWNFETGSSDVNPVDAGEDGHGTATDGQVAGNLHTDPDGNLTEGVASGANLVSLKATGTWQEQQAFQWVIDHKSQYNITALEWCDPNGGTDANQLVTQINTLTNMGVFVGGPTGNYGPANAGRTPYYQAASTNLWGGVSGYSPRGPNVDIFTPSDGIYVLWYYGGTHGELSSFGTSWAGPQMVAAAADIHQANPYLTPAQEMQIMQQSATKIYDGVTGTYVNQLNVFAAVQLAYSWSGTQPVTVAPVTPVAPTAPAAPVVPAAPASSGLPTAPTNLTASVASSTSVNLSWTSTTGGSEVGFKIERSANGGNFSAIVIVGSGVTSYTDDAYHGGVTAGVQYTYRVRAYNYLGDGAYSNTSSATPGGATATPAPVIVAPTTPAAPANGAYTTANGFPTAPSALTAAATSATTVALNWTSNTGGSEVGFKIERSTNGGGFVCITAVGKGVTSYVDDFYHGGVSPNTTYVYRVRAYNGQGDSDYSNTSSTTTPANGQAPAAPTTPTAPTGGAGPSSPTAFTVFAGSGARNMLAFFDAGDAGSFVIERSTNGGGYSTVKTLGGAGGWSFFADTGLTAGATYAYRISAVTGGGTSGYATAQVTANY